MAAILRLLVHLKDSTPITAQCLSAVEKGVGQKAEADHLARLGPDERLADADPGVTGAGDHVSVARHGVGAAGVEPAVQKTKSLHSIGDRPAKRFAFVGTRRAPAHDNVAVG